MVVSPSAWPAGSQSSLESRFFVDDGLWREAPMLTGQGSFQPLPDVKNILVTGGEGFIASWLVRHLVLKYPTAYNIVSFDKLDYCSSLHNARMLESRPNFRFWHGDITNSEDVLRCLRTHKIDTVFHLAAQSHVDLSFGNSQSFSRNNYMGTHMLLDCINSVGTVKRFYHISTDEVYGEVERDAADLTELSLTMPTNPYAASKAAAESMVTAYVKSFGLPAIIIRLNNVYGPHQYPEKIIPKFINLLQRKRPLCIHGDGQHTRRFLYAGDAVDAFDTVLHKGQIGQTYNVDSRDEIANLDLARKLLGLFGHTDANEWLEYTRDRQFNDKRYAVDGTKLRKLGWKQSVSFQQGLAATVDWYSRFSNWWGDIDAILSPFPVVDGDHVLSEKEKSKVAPTALGLTVSNGGPREMLGRHDTMSPTLLKVSAIAESVHSEAIAGAMMDNGHANGGNAPNGAKKRKADRMD